MSSLLANASRLKPEIRLAQAVSQFEADLSSEHKAAFHTYRSQSHNSPPSHSDVMRLAAEIDRRATGKVGGGRCFGPRLINVLQAVQQFAALGDVVVGGSQNIIACGVWSLVRMTLLFIVNSTSYLERLSVLFMTVGRSAPRYQTMALLYPLSKDLQSSLSEYFIVVVRLCHELLKFTQKSTLGQLVSSLSDSDTTAYKSELNFWANSIKEEVNLLIGQRIEEEARENSRFRALSNKFSETALHHRKLKTKLRLLESCSTYNYETTWKQIRKVGNATLFSQVTQYEDWRAEPDSCTLVYTGKLGSGKSVLLANVIDDLNLYVQNKDITVAYFFCRHDILESLKARTVIGSLAQQLLRPIPDLSMAAEFLSKTTSALDFEELFSLLQRALSPSFKAYFVLDGVDECKDVERQILIRQLRKLQETFALLLCVSTRLEVDSALGLRLEQFTAPNVISIPDNNPDIEKFVSAELESCLQSGKLAIGDPALILEIQRVLIEGAQGMFLWVALQIESLCAEKTDEAICQALEDLPKDLLETFSRILRRSEGLGKPYQKRILELVTVARCPLTIEELREALSVVPGDTTWNPARLLNKLYSTLACCGSLIIVDEEELTIRLVHHSVKQFLLGGSKDSNGIPFTIESAHKKMAGIIATYLNYGVFGTQLSAVVVPQIMATSIPSRIIRSTLDSSGNARSLALKLLHSRKQPNYDIGKALAGASKHFKYRSVDEFHFYSYAKSYWIHHAQYISGQEPVVYNLLVELFKRDVVDANSIDEYGHTLLLGAARNGYEAIVKLLLDSGKADANPKDRLNQTPLSWAAQNGHEAIVKLLLDSGKTDADSKDQSGQTPLSWAAENGHEAIAKLLLDSGKTDADSKDQFGQTPLSWAAQNGHEAIVKLLLNSAKADADSKNHLDQTTLSLAAQNGHEAIVKLLLDSGKTDADSKDQFGQTPLSWAAQNGHEAIVKLLLDSGKADVDSKDYLDQTPLSWAARNGHEATIKLLLDSGKADANSKDHLDQTPLSWAAENRNEAIVKLLLDSGKADADSKDHLDQTPLLWAAENGHEAIVKLLLDSGKADADSKGHLDQTPLSLAARNGHKAIVKLLLDSGKADANSKDRLNQTPLSWAAQNGHEAIVRLLLDSGKANADSKDHLDQTPLSWAAENEHEANVKLLLDFDKVDADLFALTPPTG